MSKNTLPPTTESHNPQPQPPNSKLQTLNSKLGTLNSVRHWRLFVILLIYLVLATAHGLIVPLTTGNDEWAHFLYARFIAENGRLPANLEERQNKEEVGTKSDDPPLYHLLVAAVGSGIEPTRVLRPVDGNPYRQLADNAVVSYAFIVHTGYQLFPYQGEVWLWFVGRGVSILCGLTLIILTYFTSLSLFPGQYNRALVAASFLAFIPAFIFHTSVMTYDGLGAVLTALLLLAGIKIIKNPVPWLWWILLGVLAGLAITTKYTSVLLPLEILFIVWLAWRQHRQPLTFYGLRFFATVLILLLASSWWFGFVVYNFNTIAAKGPIVGILEPLLVRGGNDSTAISATSFLFGEESVSLDSPAPARERNYPELARVMLDSFWAARIAEKYMLSPWLALLFGALTLLSGIGLWRVWKKSDTWAKTWLLLLLFHTLLVTPLILLRVFASFDALEAVQGRHILFPAATAIPLLLVWGWWQWWPRLSQVVIAGLLLWSVLGQLGWAAIVYPRPMPVWSDKNPPAHIVFNNPANQLQVDGLRLIGAEWRELPASPALEVTLWWQVDKPLPEDYLVELSLLDKSGSPVSHTLGHPVQGRYPTRAWEVGDTAQDTHWLPFASMPDGNYQLQLRLLNHQNQPLAKDVPLLLGNVALSGTNVAANSCTVWFQGQPKQGGPLAQSFRQRASFTVIADVPPSLVPLTGAGLPVQLPLASVGNFHTFVVGPDWAKTYQLAVGNTPCRTLTFNLPDRNFTEPHIALPLDVNYNNQIRLLGYQLPTRRIQPGDRLPVTLYWQALDYIGHDYQMFDNLLDSNQQRWGGYDRRAKDGYSTVLWTPGQIITDSFGVPIDPAAPPGIYTIDVGWYRQVEDLAESLPLFVDGAPTNQTGVRLGPVKVGGPPPDVVIESPTPQVHVNQMFGDQITLIGYDVAVNLKPETENPELVLTLYWQANTVPNADYTTFLHLRDSNNQTVAQKDQLPAGGRYPTSLWDTGEVIVDEIVLDVSALPLGQYTPVIGLYNFVTGARLPTPGKPENETRLESVTLQ